MNIIKGKVSVLMPVYNGEKFLKEAIDSILNQTYKNFELLILLEYGSNEESRFIVYGYQDKRIRVIENKEKLGLAASLNEGIHQATGEFIARMDADDISYPKRLEEEVSYLNRHPLISLCGTDIKKNGKRRLKASYTSVQVRFKSFLECPFFHPTVMWKNEVFRAYHLEYKTGISAEDYELWMRALDCVQAANINKPLLYYRVHEDNRSSFYAQELRIEDDEIKKEYWKRNGMDYPEKCEKLNEMWLWKEKLLLELIGHTQDFKGKDRIVQKQMLDAYLTKQNKSSIWIYKRYIDKFSDLYNNGIAAKINVFVYCIYRVMRRKIRLLLQRLKLF